MSKLADNEYQCAMCRGVFEKGWSDEEQEAEFQENFGADSSQIAVSTVCDDCYKEVKAKWQN